MSECIDRQAAIEAAKHAWAKGLEPTQYMEMIPAADVAPVKHGKWFWNPNGMDWGLGAWECSECACRNNNLPMSSKMNPLMFSGSKYCPNCGAKMDLEVG